MSKYVNESLPKEQRLGQVGINNQGLKMTIIAYRKASDIDVQFEDGIIVYNRSYGKFIKGVMKNKVKNSIVYNYPNIAKMIAIEENNLTLEDCKNISPFNHKKYYIKCPNCGKVSNNKKDLANIIYQGYSCECCSDGISIPNKFACNLLTQLKVNFQSEYSPYYFRNTQHTDFLLTDFNIILEMDGCFEGSHTKEYDMWRDFLNMKYGGYKTIRIDLTNRKEYYKNTFNYLKQQIINSELSKLFNLSNIDWELIWEQCQKSKCIECWDIWNSGIHDIVKISEILDLDVSTARKYLKQGVECGKCDYTKEESKRNGMKKNSGKNNYLAKKIICITTGEIFDTLTEGAKKHNLKSVGNITSCCKGKKKSIGKLEDGTPLVWRYLIVDHNKILRGKDISKLHTKSNQEVA